MEVYSYIFDFHRSPSFFDGWNNNFQVNSMRQDANNFEVVYCTYAPSDINDCLNGGVLNDDVTIADGGVCNLNLKYEDEIVSVRRDSTFSIGNVVIPLKAVFIRDKTSKFVLGYSINDTSFDVTNEVKLAEDTIIWSFVDGESV